MRRAQLGLTGAVLTALVLAGCSSGTGARRPQSAIGESPRRVASSQAAVVSSTSPAAPSSTAGADPSDTTSASKSPAARPAGPCDTVKAPRVVIVSVHAQHLWMCDGHRTVRDSPVTTGAVDLPYDATPIGTFHVQARDRGQTLTLLSGDRYTVQYWIPFDGPLFGFHDSSWQRMPYGSARYRTKGSHGCVHMPLAAIKFLYGWAEVGTTVSIRS